MTDRTMLQTLLQQSRYTRQHVAFVLGMTEKTLRSRLSGKSEFRLAEAQRLAELLQLTKAQREQCFFGPVRSEQKGGNARDSRAAQQD